MYAKFSKCEFWLDQVGFLGHVVSKDGIAADAKKVSAVTNWEAPKTMGEICNFLGLAGYYLRFIETSPKLPSQCQNCYRRVKKLSGQKPMRTVSKN